MKKHIVLLCSLLLVFTMYIVSPINVNAEENDSTGETLLEETEDILDKDDESVSPMSVPGGDEPDDEDWYDIAPDGVNPELPHSVDYSDMPELLSYLKPGDLVFERNGSVMGDILHHIAIVVGVIYDEDLDQEYVLLLEAVSDGVTYGLMTPTRFQEKQAIAIRLTDATEQQKMSAINWAKEELNKDYWIDVSKDPSHSNPNWYCSELAWAAYYAQGIYLDLDDNLASGGTVVLPDEIYQYANATTILHSDYDTSLTVLNSSYHTYSCDGDVYNELHTFEPYNCCYEKCSVCGYKHQIAPHSYTHRYLVNDPLTHRACCECGEVKIEDHSFEEIDGMNVCSECNFSISAEHEHSYYYVPAVRGVSHYKKCSCGIEEVQACVGAVIFGEMASCARCGQIMRSGGLLMPVAEEDALLPQRDEDYVLEA